MQKSITFINSKRMLQKTKKLSVPSTKEMIQIKVGLIGDQQTGKSSFVSRCLNNSCPTYHDATLGVQTHDRFFSLKTAPVHVTFWDFSGRIDFLEIRNQMYKEATVLLLFIDLSKPNNDSLDYWLREVKDNGGTCPLYIIGNKMDARRQSPDLGKVARERQGAYVEISCKNGEGVEALIERIVNDFK